MNELEKFMAESSKEDLGIVCLALAFKLLGVDPKKPHEVDACAMLLRMVLRVAKDDKRWIKTEPDA